MKTSSTFLAVILLLSMGQSAKSDNNQAEDSLNINQNFHNKGSVDSDLKEAADNEYVLPAETVSRFLKEPTHPVAKGNYECYQGRSRHVSEYYLAAPCEAPLNYSAIIERKPSPSTQYILNPSGFAYGRIPSVQNISKKMAASLFGQHLEIEDYRRFKLLARDREMFVLDLRFMDNCVISYRLAQVPQDIAGDAVSLKAIAFTQVKK